ncbi:hypothetical protein PoB_003218000 [Plakobranchus ocellatus]|uniref:Uncharacterized protein n=1 Tax=Plakobranchus ocellatus TaxID=259542 RepID=A0AAV4AE51_9GAST|nr:hypothetical protein PoB_003218000 [Plakobranchus ocellatus]
MIDACSQNVGNQARGKQGRADVAGCYHWLLSRQMLPSPSRDQIDLFHTLPEGLNRNLNEDHFKTVPPFPQ